MDAHIGLLPSTSTGLKVDWNKCMFYQKILRTCPTNCPADSKRPDIGCGYKSLAEQINVFVALGQVPFGINVSLWDEGDGIETTLITNRACWHRKCRSKLFHATKLNRLSENKNESAAAESSTDVNVTLNEKSPCKKIHTDVQAIHLMHAAKIIRREIFSCTSAFSGSLVGQKETMPSALVTLITMLLERPGQIESQLNVTQAVSSITQLIAFNAIKRPRRRMCQLSNDSNASPTPIIVRHQTTHETPVPVYIGLKLHSATRSQKLVDSFNKLGICIVSPINVFYK